MTSEEFAEIKARVQAAHPGPWKWKQCYELSDDWENTVHWAITDPKSQAEGNVTNHLLVLWHHWPKSLDDPVENDPDLQFIAHARSDIPSGISGIELFLLRRWRWKSGTRSLR